MYRGEVHQALSRLQLISGGTIAGLLASALQAESGIASSCTDIIANNDAKLRPGVAKLHEAIRPIAKQLNDISPSATAVELHQLGKAFDDVIKDYPSLQAFLRSGRQALSALAGAFDVAIQQNKSPPAIIGIVRLAIDLACCYAHYDALILLFRQYDDRVNLGDTATVIEIDGAHTIAEFSGYLNVIAILGDAAGKAAAGPASDTLPSAEAGISIANIESGSPIKINLLGNGKAIQLLLSMLRDVVRISYQHLTTHGRVIQTMETFARAKELGINSPELLSHLEAAMSDASEVYAESIEKTRAKVSIDGRDIGGGVTTPLISLDLAVENSAPRLNGPNGDNEI